MLEKIGHIKNPLTVIAMFAGIAELSGTVVLPFLDNAVQEVYVWFLMGFPVLMVYLFYRTLWRDHTVLYAPSDFREEGNFISLFKGYSSGVHYSSLSEIPADEALAPLDEALSGEDSEPQVHQESEDLRSDREAPVDAEPPSVHQEETKHSAGDSRIKEPADPASRRRKTQAFMHDITRHIIASDLVRELGGKFKVEVSPKQLPNLKFDVVVESSTVFCVAEIIQASGYFEKINKVKVAILSAGKLYDSLPEVDRSKFVLRLVFVFKDFERFTDDLKDVLRSMIMNAPFNIVVDERIGGSSSGRIVPMT